MWVQTHKGYLKIVAMISLTFSIILSILIVGIRLESLALLGILGLISVLYVIPFGSKSLREIPFLKSIFVATVWTGFVILYPMLNEDVSWKPYLADLCAFFCFFFALTIPFDIRDLLVDDPHQRTIPQVFGIFGAKVFALTLLMISLFIIANINQEIWKKLYAALLFLGIALLILGTKPSRSNYYFALLDASMIVFGIFFFLP